MDKDCKFTLHYFNGRGRAEVIRLMLAYAKKEYTDHRMAQEEWPKFKPQMPLTQVPVLEFTNKAGKTTVMCQSAAIIRHLASLFDMGGKTPEQKARVDEAYESLREIFELGVRMIFEKDAAAKAKLLEQLATELAPRIFGMLEKHAKECGGKNLTGGDGFTYADLTLSMLAGGPQGKATGLLPPEAAAKFSAAFPTVFGIAKAVCEVPQIKEYLAKRPETEF